MGEIRGGSLGELNVGIELSEIELTANAEREPLGIVFLSGFPRWRPSGKTAKLPHGQRVYRRAA